MLDTAIVGAGLCGLTLAHHLQAQGRDFALFEARGRLGGRILTANSEVAGVALDLGPTWFWPDTQPRITRLVADLGLHSFPQHDTGEVLNLVDHDKQPDVLNRPHLHGGARRVEGGMGALVAALSQGLPAESLRLNHVLSAVEDRGDHVVLRFQYGEETVEVQARRAVLALPPRLVEEKVQFQPPLDGQVREAMRETYTWMADQAKALVAYARPFWRSAGHSGNAFVHHEHVVLGEIFDACNEDGSKAALGGFFSLPPELRTSLSKGMSMLVSSQMVQVFGTDAEGGEQHVQDWASEPYTCSSRDSIPPDSHPEYGHPSLRLPQWGGRLHFGGSETASYGGGYLEGALEAAARIQRAVSQAPTVTRLEPRTLTTQNETSLARFGEWVGAQRGEILERYRKQLHRKLAAQYKEQITQRAVLDAMEQVYSEALALLETLPFDASAEGIFQGRAELTPKVLAPFIGFNKTLLDEVVVHNRTSCALSNFPDEHKVSPEYLETIARDLAAAWREFALGVNTLLLAKAQGISAVATAA
ncbi:FAD-dependent oxidoreductase [Methylococcus sp. EFPC2]|uniref:flavin monoamine oxidase family protein n=1 Tax=Methylococcus sp. EFPC2 TaxID=2812648 RepID=UPI00196761A6|nr:FAD-dependent oxidoreductase [Methylococcus sp. EFPC2]QSA99301.1 FAD-dependent oxidoreductase [Methylococcus sp. EFPC2]